MIRDESGSARRANNDKDVKTLLVSSVLDETVNTDEAGSAPFALTRAVFANIIETRPPLAIVIARYYESVPNVRKPIKVVAAFGIEARVRIEDVHKAMRAIWRAE
ncbi:MAG: hypothetical protein Q9194_002036 [Teloschistes cf. exilis]